MDKRKAIPAIVWQENKWFVAKALNLEVASQGKTPKEALKNLQEAIDLLLEDEEIKIPVGFFNQHPQLAQIYV